MAEGFDKAAGETAAQGVRIGTADRPLTAGATRPTRLARWAWPAALAVAAVVLFLCYLRLSHNTPGNSDGADQVLQASDMLHGNWLLSGWTVGDVSYYTTELPEYIVVEKILGVIGPDVIHVAAAITYTLLVLLAGLLAKGRATGKEGVIRALIAAGILLAPQLGHGLALQLSQPDHLGTQVPLLAIFLVLDRAPRRWYTPVAIGVLLTWVIIADRVAVLDAALPLAVVCGIRGYRALFRHRRPASSLWFEFSLAAAGLLSVGLSQLVVSVIGLMGGYTSLPLPTQQLARWGDLQHHFAVTAEGIFILYGSFFAGLSPASVAIAVVHLAGLALALWGVGRAFRRFFSTDELIVPVMATAIVLNLAAYIASVVPVTWFDTREIVVLLPFGAVLAGRLLAGTLARARLRPVLAGLLACYVIGLGYGMAQPAKTDSEQPVVAWLEAHHLTTGLGTYAESNVITMDSGGRVAVRTVAWQLPRAVPRAYESKASWYDPRLSYANFVLVNGADAKPGSNGVIIPYQDIVALAGPPAHTYHYKTFTIWVWNHNLLADLGGPPSSFPGDVH
ncbi:MAG TPA: hypothetical protein VMK84_26020 [Streptosporangiaceae bacterium]|nr:hypothetical protein [Streptosporangiaceae bacterium]